MKLERPADFEDACKADDALLRLERTHHGSGQSEHVVCLFNISPEPVDTIEIPQGETLCSVNSVQSAGLGPYAALVVRV